MITGNTLIELGYKPKEWFGKAIKYCNDYNISKDDILDAIKQFLPPPFISPYSESISYYKNIICETEEELENLISVEATMDIVMKTPTVITAAIMPDACPAGNIGQIPVGGIVVAKNAIHPSMHSADICCSVMVTGFGNHKPKDILDLMHKVTDFGPGPRKNKIKFDLPQELATKIKNNRFFNQKAIASAYNQLGTQGDGNHFAYVGTLKSTEETCLVTHHGSRGLGANLYKEGMIYAEKYRRKVSPETDINNAWIDYNSIEGKEYWNALQLVREWTKLNHLVLHNWIQENIKYKSKLHFWNEHNFVFKKDDLFYHAKGATPLLDEFVPDNKTGLRLIPLNMGESILIVKGKETENNLGFAPHGAGRNLSRTKHKLKNKDISNTEILKKETENLDIRFYFDDPDISELPSAYKNAQSVKNQIKHFNLGTVVDEIIPYGCIMAGNYKKFWE